MMNNYYLLLPLLVIFTACGGQNNSSNSGATAAESSVTEAVPVSVQKIKPETFRHFLSIQGTVESDKTIMISPKANGTVEQVLVKAGQKVEKGEVLARLDGEITKSQINEVQTQLELARTTFERRKNLREKEVGSEIQFLQAKNQVESLESKLATLQEQYENYTINTSIPGRVSQVSIKEGETVSPAQPVFQIANSEALKVSAQISEAYLSTVDETDSVAIRFPSIDEVITKRLDVANKVIDPANRTFDVEVFLSRGSDRIVPNMLAKLKINDYTQQNALVVSVNNVQQNQQGQFVYVAEQTDSVMVAKRQEVQTDASYGQQIVVTEGLQAGDRIITVGDSKVNNNQPIQITNN